VQSEEFLTKGKNADDLNPPNITAEGLNVHYAAISTGSSYVAQHLRTTVNAPHDYISEQQTVGSQDKDNQAGRLSGPLALWRRVSRTLNVSHSRGGRSEFLTPSAIQPRALTTFLLGFFVLGPHCSLLP